MGHADPALPGGRPAPVLGAQGAAARHHLKSLTQSLRGLERDGFLTRVAYETPDRRVEYALTPLGRGLLGPLDAACEWTREHWDELIDAQEAGLSGEGAR